MRRSIRSNMVKLSRARRKLTDEQVAEAIARVVLGETCTAVAKSLGVAPTTIQDYVSGNRTRGLWRSSLEGDR